MCAGIYSQRLKLIIFAIFISLFIYGITRESSDCSSNSGSSIEENSILLLNPQNLNKTGSIYEINEDIDLKGRSITLPSRSTLKFSGGRIKNGEIIGNESSIIALCIPIFDNIKFSGSWMLDAVSFSWFDPQSNNPNFDNSPLLKSALSLSKASGCKLKIPSGHFYFLTPIELDEDNYYINIEGVNSNSSLYDYEFRYKTSALTILGSSLFTKLGKSSTPIDIRGRMCGLSCFGKKQKTNVLFNNVILRGFKFQNNVFGNFNTVVHGRMVSTSSIQNNRIMGVSHLLKWESDVKSEYVLVDSEISGNYLNGAIDPELEPNSLLVGRVTFSRIENNYIDFWKYLVYSNRQGICENVVISGNTIDYCYSLTNTNIIEGVLLTGNTINACSWASAKSTAWKKTNDSDVIRNKWIFVHPQKAAKWVNISNNSFKGDFLFVASEHVELENTIVKCNLVQSPTCVVVNSSKTLCGLCDFDYYHSTGVPQ